MTDLEHKITERMKAINSYPPMIYPEQSADFAAGYTSALDWVYGELQGEWSDKWPVTQGVYWFHGYLSNFDEKNNKTATYLVKIRISSNNHPMYICEGHFLYRTDGAKGVWRQAILPEPPK